MDGSLSQYTTFFLVMYNIAWQCDNIPSSKLGQEITTFTCRIRHFYHLSTYPYDTVPVFTRHVITHAHKEVGVGISSLYRESHKRLNLT